MGIRKLSAPPFILRASIFILAVYLLLYVHSEYSVFVYSWCRNKLQNQTLWGCHLRKFPFVQLIGTGAFVISWETTCRMHDEVEFGWNAVPLQRGEWDGWKEKNEYVLGAKDMEHVKLASRHHLYRVKLEGLSPENMLEYYVKVSQKVDPIRGSFLVLPDQTSPVAPPIAPIVNPIEIAIVGDNQDGIGVFSKICKNIERRNPHLMIHLGDAIQNFRNIDAWQSEFFDSVGWYAGLSTRCPMLIVQGNHDVHERTKAHGKYILPSYENYYNAVSIGPARFIILDSTQETDTQASWLESELSKPSTQKSPFKIILCHVPPFIEFWNPKSWAAGEHRWPAYVKARLQPLWEKYRVDLVISGHQHNYQRGMWKGVNYVTSGGGGGSLDKTRVEDYHVFKTTIFKHHYIMMSVARNGLSLRVFSANDRLLDSFYIPRSFARKMKPSEMLPQ